MTDFWSIGGFVVGIAGFIAAIIFYFKGKGKKILEYRIHTNRILFPLTKSVFEKAPKLQILYDQQPINALQFTTITFTNIGSQTIYPKDFAAHEQLGIKVSVRFLGTDPEFKINEDNPNSAIVIKPSNENLVRIGFDFLKPKQSFQISFLHDGSVDVLGELTSGRIQEHDDFPEIPDSLYIIMITAFVVYVLNVWCTIIFPIEDYQMLGICIQMVTFAAAAIGFIIAAIRWLLNKIFSKFFKK